METDQHLNFKTGLSALAIIAVWAAIFCPRAEAQLSYTGGTVTQTFDSLSNTGITNTFANNLTIPGVYAFQSAGSNTAGAITNYRADNGSSTTGSLYSFGTMAATERALGSLSSGTPGTLSYGFVFTNNTGTTLSSIAVGYTGEEWRQGGNTAAQTLAFNYMIDPTAAAVTLTNFTATTGFTADTNLNFVTPTVAASGTTGAALDGNAAANRTVLSDTINGLTISPGATIYLRFTDINDTGNDHALAIDDFSFSASGTTPVPEPTTILGGALVAVAFAWNQRRRLGGLAGSIWARRAA